jgi:hypothetical protein
VTAHLGAEGIEAADVGGYRVVSVPNFFAIVA